MSDELGTCDTALGPHEKEPACENWKPLAAPAPKLEASAAKKVPICVDHAGCDACFAYEEYILAQKDAEIARLTQERDAAQKDVEYWRTLARKDAGGLAALELERVRAAITEAQWRSNHWPPLGALRTVESLTRWIEGRQAEQYEHTAELQRREKELSAKNS
jgi:hypothetical protein